MVYLCAEVTAVFQPNAGNTAQYPALYQFPQPNVLRVEPLMKDHAKGQAACCGGAVHFQRGT